MSKNIKDKVVVITGASSGLEEATARHLASLGAKVVLGARREDKLKAIAYAIEQPDDVDINEIVLRPTV